MTAAAFYGPWTVEIVQSGQFSEDPRFAMTVSGSENADGEREPIVGTQLHIIGDEWYLSIETPAPVLSEMSRTSVYDLNDGLVVTLVGRTIVHNSTVVLVCRPDNGLLNPGPLAEPPFDFSYPESYLTD